VWITGGKIIDRKKLNCSLKSLIQWHFVDYRSHMDYPGLEAGIVVLSRAIIIIIIIIIIITTTTISCDLSFFSWCLSG